MGLARKMRSLVENGSLVVSLSGNSMLPDIQILDVGLIAECQLSV